MEDVEVISETIDSVVCRWCGSGANVVEIDGSAGSEDPHGRAGATGAADDGEPVVSGGVGSSGGAG